MGDALIGLAAVCLVIGLVVLGCIVAGMLPA